MRKLFLLIALFVFVGGSTLFAQTKVITGTVTSAVEGEGAVPGVTIHVVGTTVGTLTDGKGQYSITVPANAKALLFSFVGMKTQEIPFTGQNVIDVVMTQDFLNLDEVIVTGVAAGTPKKKMAVSVERVGENQLKEVYASSASSALQGKVSGVTVVNSTGEPGGSATILVRGATQISGSQAPLIILDGAIMEGSLGDINVDDIESMEVVKGASASALYGSRAGNGVIAVTTRRGNSLAEGKTEIIIRNEYGMTSLAKKYDLATHHAWALAADQANFSFTKYDGVTYPANYSGTIGGYSGSRYLKTNQYMDSPYAVLYDHENALFKGNDYYTNYVSVGSNSGKTNFLVSFENNGQSGLLVETTGYKRNSFRVNVDHRVTNKLSVSASNLYIKSYTQDPGGDSKTNGGIFFNLLLSAPDTDFNQANPDNQPYLFIPNAWESTTENPIYSIWKNKDTNNRDRILGTYSAKYNITNTLNLEGKYAFEYSNSRNQQYSPYDTYQRSGGAPVYSKGSLYIYNSKLLSQNTQVTLNYNQKFGDFNTRAKLSYLFEKSEFFSNSATGYDFSLNGVPSFDAIVGDKSITSYEDKIIAKNYFGILYVDYKDKYIFDGMARYDGSSLFGSDARWNPYFRVSAAYRLTEDLPINGIQEFKLRAAYGTAGQRPGFADQYEVMGISNGNVSKSQFGNSMLKPSLSKEVEVGLNIDFLNRFSFELVHSTNNTTDQILSIPLAVQFGGWPSQTQNAGTLNSKVWESSFNAQVIRKGDLSYNIGFVFDNVITKITKLDAPAYQTGPQGQEANKVFYIREGETFGVMYGYSWVKSLEEMTLQLPTVNNPSTFYDDTKIDSYVVNSDGYVIVKGTEGTTSELPIKKLGTDGKALFSKIGNTNPKFRLSMTNNISYKGFGLYALIEWKNGGDLYNRSAQWLTRDNRAGMMDQFGKPDYLKKAIPYYKGFYDVNTCNAFWVEDASYLKLRELSLSYSVSKKALENFAKGYIKGIKLSVIGKNLVTITKYSGYDPEVQTTDGTQYYAYDFMGYPNYRSYAASLEFKF
jgi:TonB-linked SusC/RagA family outer membrane protein